MLTFKSDKKFDTFLASCGVTYKKAYTDIQWSFSGVVSAGTFFITLIISLFWGFNTLDN